MSIIAITSALTCAVQTALHQRSEVPAQPLGWLASAQEALEAEDAEKIIQCAYDINDAHRGYQSSFDCKGWLEDIREAVRNHRLLLKRNDTSESPLPLAIPTEEAEPVATQVKTMDEALAKIKQLEAFNDQLHQLVYSTHGIAISVMNDEVFIDGFGDMPIGMANSAFLISEENKRLTKEIEGFLTKSEHQFQAVHNELVIDLDVPDGGSVIEAVSKLQSENAELKILNANLSAAESRAMNQVELLKEELALKEEMLTKLTENAHQERAIGRAEALSLLLAQDCEEFEKNFGASSETGDTGDYAYFWDEDKLKDLLRIDEPAYSFLSHIEGLYQSAFWDLHFVQDEQSKFKTLAFDFVSALHNEHAVTLPASLAALSQRLLQESTLRATTGLTWYSVENVPMPADKYVKAFHTIHQCEITGFIPSQGAYAGQFLEKTKTTVWPLSAFSYWTDITVSPLKERAANAL